MPIACGIPKNIHSNYSVCCSQLETTRFLSEGDLCTKQLDKKIPDDNEFDNCVLISDAPPEDLQPPVPKSMDEDEIDAIVILVLRVRLETLAWRELKKIRVL